MDENFALAAAVAQKLGFVDLAVLQDCYEDWYPNHFQKKSGVKFLDFLHNTNRISSDERNVIQRVILTSLKRHSYNEGMALQSMMRKNDLHQLASMLNSAGVDVKQLDVGSDVRRMLEETLRISELERRVVKELPHVQSKYEIRSLLAAGGMGYVFLADDLNFESASIMLGSEKPMPREVVLKLAKPGAGTDRFILESYVTGMLEHPNIPPVYDIGRIEIDDAELKRLNGMILDFSHRKRRSPEFFDQSSYVFMAQKYLREGHTLREKLDSANDGKPVERRQLLEWFDKVCEAVEFAHNHGVLHRDLKPENVMVDRDGVVNVMDWGLARIKGVPDIRSREFGVLSPMRTQMTLEGEVMGTPAYMAPEQAAGLADKIDEQTDVYTLGVILYQLLSNHLPYDDTSIDALFLISNLSTTPLRPSQHVIKDRKHSEKIKTLASKETVVKTPGEAIIQMRKIHPAPPILSDLDDVVMKAIAKKKDDRYKSVSELRFALKEALTAHKSHRRLAEKYREEALQGKGAEFYEVALDEFDNEILAYEQKVKDYELSEGQGSDSNGRAAIVELLLGTARIHNVRAQYSKEIDCLKRAQEIRSPAKLQNRELDNEIEFQIARSHHLNREYETSIGILERILPDARDLQNFSRASQICLLSGINYFRMHYATEKSEEKNVLLRHSLDSLAEGEHYVAKSLEACANEREDKSTLARIWMAIGGVYSIEGKFVEAIDKRRQAAKIFEELNDKNRLADALKLIGQVYFKMENYDQAVPVLTQALNIAITIEKNELSAGIYSILGAIHHVRNDVPEAKACFRETKNLLEKITGPDKDLLGKQLNEYLSQHKINL